jgi:CshA-type fibril repeat protein
VINPNGPTAISDSATTAFDTPVTIDAKANDLSSAGTTLNSSKIDLDPSTPVQDSSLTVAAGTFILQPDGTIKFVPVAGFVGIVSTPYTIQDSLGQTSASANLTVTVSNPAAPIATKDSTSTAFNTPLNLEPKLNDTSSTGTTLDANKIDLDPSTPAQDLSLTVAGGTFNLQPDGSVTFTPVVGFVGTATTNYTIQDSLGQTSNVVMLEVTVNAPLAPVATNDSSSTPFNTAVTVDANLNDTSSTGTTLDSSTIDLDPSTPAFDSSITIAAGTFTLEPDGSIKFTPVSGFVGTASTPYTIPTWQT